MEAWLTTGKAIARPRLQTSTWHTYLPLFKPPISLKRLDDKKIKVIQATFLSEKDKKKTPDPHLAHLPTSLPLSHLSL